MPRKGHTKFSDKRVQVPKKLNQQMKRLHDEGKKMDKIIEILQLGNIPRSTFYSCISSNGGEETSHKTRNRTVDSIQVEFEREVTLLYRGRARSRGFGQKFVDICCEKIREKNQKFRDNDKIASMKFSNHYIYGLMNRRKKYIVKNFSSKKKF